MSDKTAQEVAKVLANPLDALDDFEQEQLGFYLDEQDYVQWFQSVREAITAVVQERDALRERVAELEKDAARYQFWRNRWADEQFLSTLAGTIRQLSDPLIRGDYNNLDIVSDAAIAASKEAP